MIDALQDAEESNYETMSSSNGTRPVTRRKTDCKLNPRFRLFTFLPNEH